MDKLVELKETITDKKKELYEIEERETNEINKIKKVIYKEIDNVIETINNLKRKIKKKKEYVRAKRNDITKLEQKYEGTIKRNKLEENYTPFCIKTAIYKTRYYDRDDLKKHLDKECLEENCSTCLANQFINNRYGVCESDDLENWMDEYVKKNSNVYGQLNKKSAKKDYILDSFDTFDGIDSYNDFSYSQGI